MPMSHNKIERMTDLLKLMERVVSQDSSHGTVALTSTDGRGEARAERTHQEGNEHP